MSLCLVLSGCAAWPGGGIFGPHYTQFRVTNVRGEVIAEWIARGWYSREAEGYRIVAVQRTSGEPFSQTTFYPGGWRTKVSGPNIQRWRVDKPDWIVRMERGLPESAASGVRLKPLMAPGAAVKGARATGTRAPASP